MEIKINENEIKVDGVIYRKTEETKPEFKVGEWIIGINECRPYNVARLEKKENGHNFIYNSYDSSGVQEVSVSSHYCRHATKEEIESHLKKICDEKYVGKMVRCLFDRNYNEPDFQVQKVKYFDEYKPISDELRYSDGFHWICVYKQGEWATILPDKKKLPKTQVEAAAFLADYNASGKAIHDFINNYE